MLFWKDVLYPGTLVLPGEDQRPRKITFTHEDIRNAARIGNQKLQEHYQIPLCWEHQDIGPYRENEPLDAEKTKHVFGFARQFRVASDGSLQVLLDVPDPKDCKQFAKVKYVSPTVQFDWMDPTGQVWPGATIAHIAATARPVQHLQKPVPLACQRISLSLSEIQRGALMNENETSELTPTAPSKMQLVLQALRAEGLILGDDEPEDLDQFLDRLLVALQTKQAAEASEEEQAKLSEEQEEPHEELQEEEETHQEELLEHSEESEEEEYPFETKKEDVKPAAPPIAMSYAAAKKQLQIAQKYARSNLRQRVQRLLKTGRITPQIAQRLLQNTATVKLSFTPQGHLAVNHLTAQIAAYEALPAKHAFGRRASLPATQVGKKPGFFDVNDDEAVLRLWDKK